MEMHGAAQCGELDALKNATPAVRGDANPFDDFHPEPRSPEIRALATPYEPSPTADELISEWCGGNGSPLDLFESALARVPTQFGSPDGTFDPCWRLEVAAAAVDALLDVAAIPDPRDPHCARELRLLIARWVVAIGESMPEAQAWETLPVEVAQEAWTRMRRLMVAVQGVLSLNSWGFAALCARRHEAAARRGGPERRAFHRREAESLWEFAELLAPLPSSAFAARRSERSTRARRRTGSPRRGNSARGGSSPGRPLSDDGRPSVAPAFLTGRAS
jgi:hypothetical protein